MKKELAEQEKAKHTNLVNKLLIHKNHNAKMLVMEIGINAKFPGGDSYFVYCKLRGKSGDVTETLEYVLANYCVSVVPM